MRRSPARLVIALSVAAALAVFILYTSIAGAGTPQIVPSQIQRYGGQNVMLVGQVVTTRGDAHTSSGMRFVLSDPNKRTGRVRVVYRGSVPDLYRIGRIVVVSGTLRSGTFDATQLSTKCPSKYSSAKSNSTT